MEKDERESGKQVLNFMARAVLKMVRGVRVKRHIRTGFPKHEIIRLCEELDANLVVLGSHTRKGLDRILLGSVANAVVSNAACSSVVIRLSDDQLKTEEPLDFTLDDMPERIKEDVEIGVPNQVRKFPAAQEAGKKTSKV